MPTFLRAASMTLRTGSSLRGLRDDDGVTWLVTDDLASAVEKVTPTHGNSMVTAKGREGIPGGELFTEPGFVSVISIPHLASVVLDLPLSPSEEPAERLSEVLGEPVDALFSALDGTPRTEPEGDGESAVPVVDEPGAPVIAASVTLGASRGGVPVPGQSMIVDVDGDVWIPIASRTEVPPADTWQGLREVVDSLHRCEPLAGRTTRHPGLRSDDEDTALLCLPPGTLTRVLSEKPSTAALSEVTDPAMWRWMLAETFPRLLDAAAPLRAAMIGPTEAMGTDQMSMSRAAVDLGTTATALVAMLEMRGSLTRTGSSLRPWRVTGDADLLTVSPASGHALWCPALMHYDAVDALRMRLSSSGLL